jgi:hypothetical protein
MDDVRGINKQDLQAWKTFRAENETPAAIRFANVSTDAVL